MRTLHPAFRVADLPASLRFYRALGYAEVGTVPGTSLGGLTLLKLPDDEFAALELVDDPRRRPTGSGLSHLAVQVDSLAEAIDSLRAAGFEPGGVELPGGADGPRTSWATDPDGNRIELTEWPEGHPLGLTAADFPSRP
jgi:lactoylglutathione lyase